MEAAQRGSHGRGSDTRKKELAEKLADAVDYGTQEDFVAAVKSYKPEIGKAEL